MLPVQHRQKPFGCPLRPSWIELACIAFTTACTGFFAGIAAGQTLPLAPLATAPANAASSNSGLVEPVMRTDYAMEVGPGWSPRRGLSGQSVGPSSSSEAATPRPTYPDFKVTGVMHLDTARFAQSSASRSVLGDLQDGTGFRRARFAITGSINPTMTYMMELDFAQSQARFVDMWGQVNDTPFGKVRIGRFRQPFGMTELTSIRELPSLERPSAFALAPFRQTGIMCFDTYAEEHGTWAVSGFRSLSDNFGNVYGDDGGLGTAARITRLVLDGGEAGVVHLGGGASYLDPARNQWLFVSQDEIFVGQQPNLGPTAFSVAPLVGVPPFVNSGVMNVDSLLLFNLEAAASIGRGLVQAEQRWARVDLSTGDSRVVTAAYLTLRWMLTGEEIPYNHAGGVFGRIKPLQAFDLQQGTWGAWEVVSQVSSINLNPLFAQPDVPGPTRRLLSTTVGLNWYWNANAKCQFECVNGSLNDPLLGDSVSTTVAARFQIDF